MNVLKLISHKMGKNSPKFLIYFTDRSYMTWKSQRSAIAYEALKALVHSHIVPEGQRKDRLIAILEHLDTDMMGITRAREDLVAKIQAKVDENIIEQDPLNNVNNLGENSIN